MTPFPPALRAALEAGAAAAPAPAAVGRLTELLKETLAELQRLEAPHVEDLSFDSRWTSLGDEALRAGRGLCRTRPTGGRYPDSPGGTSKLDVRF
jgi:hypothetical protein